MKTVEKNLVKPQYASDLPFIPMNYQDRDVLVGKLMGVLEAVMPQGKQLDATKDLVKQTISSVFTHGFNNCFQILKGDSPTIEGYYDEYVLALWEVALGNKSTEDR